ncbi:MAG: hypothetical protein R3F43_00650 [bacterium]
MKSILLALAALAISTPVLAAKVVRDSSGAWSRQNNGGGGAQLLPAPLAASSPCRSRLDRQQRGGKVTQPAPTKATPERSPN